MECGGLESERKRERTKEGKSVHMCRPDAQKRRGA